jgi:hypothetical protein
MVSVTVAGVIKELRSYFGLPGGRVISPPPSKVQVSIFCALAVVMLGLSLNNYSSFQIGQYQDDAKYVVLAQSLALSDSYGYINVPGQPLPAQYPFGYPLILSPIAMFFPQAPDMMKFASLMATLLNAFLLFVGWPYLSRNKSYWWGLTIAALYGLSPIVAGHTRMVMSEPVFTAFALATLILAEKYVLSEKDMRLPIFLSGILSVFTLFVRTIGLVLFAAILGRILVLSISKLSKVRRLVYFMSGGISLIFVVVAATPVEFQDLIPTEYTNQLVNPQDYEYVNIEDALVPRSISGFLAYTESYLRKAVIPVGGGQNEIEFGKRFGIPDLPLLTGLVTGSLILLGSLSVLHGEGLSPTAFVFEILYFGVVVAWPWRGERLLYPIQPFLFYQLLLGIMLLAGVIQHFSFSPPIVKKYFADLGVAAMVTIILIISFYKGAINYRVVAESADAAGRSIVAVNNNAPLLSRDLRVGAVWIRDNSSTDALVMARYPQSIYLYSQRKTVDYPQAFTGSQLIEAIELQGVDYILIAPVWQLGGAWAYDTYTLEMLLPLLDELVSKGKLELVYQSFGDRVSVYHAVN